MQGGRKRAAWKQELKNKFNDRNSSIDERPKTRTGEVGEDPSLPDTNMRPEPEEQHPDIRLRERNPTPQQQ